MTEVIHVDFENEGRLRRELQRATRQRDFLRSIGRQGFFTPATARLYERLGQIIRDREEGLGIKPLTEVPHD